MSDRVSDTERRVYVLPTELVERIRQFQVSQGLPSEVEAVRRLLDSALQMRDTLDDILKKLRAKFSEEKDLRALARDVLVSHALVKSVSFGEGEVSFTFAGDERGKIDSSGRTYRGIGYDDWDIYPKPTQVSSKYQSSWEKPKGGDLDDDIPF